MKIQTGGFGNVVAEPVAQPNKGAVFTHAAAVIDDVQATADRIQERAQHNREALQRAKAANAFAKYQLDVEDTGRQLEEEMASGTLNYEKAQGEYDTRIKKLAVPQVELDNPVDRENQSQGMTIAQGRGRQRLAPAIYAARQRDGVAQLDQFFDTQAKRAIEPEANVDAINQSADAFAANARAYGIPEDVIARKVQAFKDGNWFNNATQRAVEADTDIAGLRAVLHDLTASDGLYATKLDPEKRNALQASVQSKIDRIELRAAATVDRREAKAERTVATIERQISSGVPATPEMWADWARVVDGTSVKGDFDQLVHTEREIQSVLRAPIADQVRLVQERKADLDKNGGTLAQAANVERLTRAVQSNVKLLTDSPVLFAEQRLGDENEPIDFAATMLDGAAGANAAATLQERASRIRALGKQFGAQVPMRPLLPQEAKQLGDMMATGTSSQVAELFNTLSDAAGGPDIYRGIMQQVAPDAPVKAMAGLLAGKRRELTTASHWFKPDETVTSRDVAATMLEGERLLNRSSTAKAEDGKAQTRLVLPDTKSLQERFANEVGTAFAGRPGAQETAFQAVVAYYAGKSAQTGRIAKDSSDVDSNLVREAVTATLGNVVDFNGAGEVLAPWGMVEGDFNNRVAREFAAEAKRRGLPENLSPELSAFGLSNAGGDGQYAVTIGRQLLLDKAGNPVVLDIRPHDARDQRGFITR